ncbi:MAG: bifunctional glutamate N-acetyltransferase/amino-acid acetyltransferase ArgJ, partial [bacterium]
TFTRNSFCAAPVNLSRARLRSGKARAIVVNSGCANAATGIAGMRDAELVTRDVARLLSIDCREVLPASTGRIGRRLPLKKIRSGMGTLVERLSVAGGKDAARAILTTDTRPKEAVRRLVIGRKRVTIGGMAKGAGMIHPMMATMLAFITTDAAITPGCLREILRKSVEKSFNRISIDGDQSTNDSVFILASGLAGNAAIERSGSRAGRMFARALDKVTATLAETIVLDGEGASKLVEILVRGARDRSEARRIGFAIANSPLFKTAMYGEEPNWGRVLSSAGSAGVGLNPERVSVMLQGKCVFRRGAPAGVSEEALRKRMRTKRIEVEIGLGRGRVEERILTCDLTPEYVELNKT